MVHYNQLEALYPETSVTKTIWINVQRLDNSEEFDLRTNHSQNLTGRVAQWIRRLTSNQKIASSSLVVVKAILFTIWPCADKVQE